MAFFQCLFILIVKTVSSQFTQHVDLQKLGEIILKGEKYNILKPTVHKITEHFKDEKLRRDTRGDERIFVDDYGFRHFWKGLENRKSYSKTENGIENDRRDDDMHKEEGGVLRRAPAKTTAKPAAKKPAAKPAAKKPTAKPAAKKPAKPAAKQQLKLNVSNSNKTADVGRERTIAKSYFFCPFFGVIAMKGFID